MDAPQRRVLQREGRGMDIGPVHTKVRLYLGGGGLLQRGFEGKKVRYANRIYRTLKASKGDRQWEQMNEVPSTSFP